MKQQGLTEQEFIRLPNFEYVRNEVDFLNFEVQKVASESAKQFREAEAERVEKFILFLSSMDSVEKKMKKFDDLLVAHMEDLVLPILEQMVENDFSYLPIINEENECVEVFSAYVLMTYNSLGKALDKRMEIRDVHLDSKSGGKSGDFVR